MSEQLYDNDVVTMRDFIREEDMMSNSKKIGKRIRTLRESKCIKT